MKLLNRRREQPVANALISAIRRTTRRWTAGAVRSDPGRQRGHAADEALAELWPPTNLERLARTYWCTSSRVSLGLIRVHYSRRRARTSSSSPAPSSCCASSPPEYELTRDRGDRALAHPRRPARRRARGDDGYLEIDVRRLPSERAGYGALHVEVEVANFYPALAGRSVVLRQHAVAHPRDRHPRIPQAPGPLELEESAVGRFAEPSGGPRAAGTASASGTSRSARRRGRPSARSRRRRDGLRGRLGLRGDRALRSAR